MYFDSISLYVGRKVDIEIDDLLTLHNWECRMPRREPLLPKSAATLLAIHSNRDTSDAEIWREWLYQKLFLAARKSIVVPQPFQIIDQSGETLQGNYTVKQPYREDKWKNKTNLREQTIPWPNLPVLTEIMKDELGQLGGEKLSLRIEKVSGFKEEEDFCKWLSGTWLESAVLSVLRDCSKALQLSDYCMNLIPRPKKGGREFEFDVIAMRGYQLFAFSCTTEGKERGLLKQKLFEMCIRARQMGGDEACAALVCCMDQEKLNELDKEVASEVGAKGRICVFGREQLADLSTHITNWIREQSGEE